ncbi:MAG: metal-dependent hydrolase [Synergistaceae bacterium]|uniref:metal-dependent hydrolase n=1 Tax=Aminivibrio sp. TaxID=1872489 RepID=UPI001DE23BA6|nr:metal-dependent hydrolase [Synergistaceae bacterium]NCC56234.1 metal-dependent hydrolase [Synergistales bacterium]MDD3390807.1 metal-dependent hydrolase [Synergistaceae bacterium]MDD3688880.1 metal-dependent hydrolase [Synergistaceae bacterium]MDD4020251.1 metal-dependent hydrolase [Synergistaceae bacterium]
MMKLRYLGHSAFELRGGGAVILADPFLSGNTENGLSAESFDEVDFIFVTHGHSDHIGDTEKIALRTGAIVVANFELCHYFGKKGLTCHPMHIGGSFDFPFGRVKMTPALHGSDIMEGDTIIPGGNPCGFLFDIGGVKVYHAGDTGLTMDMQLLAEEGVKAALLPIGGNFVMDVKDAARAVNFIRPEIAVPIHYDTFPVIKADPGEFARLVGSAAEVRIMKTGDEMELS